MGRQSFGVFRYREDCGPVCLILLLSASDFLVYWYVDSIPFLFGWLLLWGVPKACICSWHHHHQHVATFTTTWLNRLLELSYALHTGVTTNAWVLHHNLGHHRHYLDQTKDESAWKDSRGVSMGAVRYTLTVALTAYPRAFKVGKQHPKYQQGFVTWGVVAGTLVAILTYFKPLSALFLFCIPMVVGLLGTVWHTYYHHAGLDTDDHFQASHNVLHRWYNIATGNLGYHTAHHVKPGLHWSRLPDFHASIAHKIPLHLFVEPCIPFKWLPSGTRDEYIVTGEREASHERETTSLSARRKVG
jgi:fatty acid desaturase